MSTPDDDAVAAGHSVDPAGWRVLFDELMSLIAGRFGRAEPRRTAREFVLGLLSPLERKNCWWLAEQRGRSVAIPTLNPKWTSSVRRAPGLPSVSRHRLRDLTEEADYQAERVDGPLEQLGYGQPGPAGQTSRSAYSLVVVCRGSS